MRERGVVDGVRRACRGQDGDLADHVARGLRFEAVHILVGQQLAQMLPLGLERRRGPTGWRERRVVLDAVDDAAGQRPGVDEGRSAKADRAVTRHLTKYLAYAATSGSVGTAVLRRIAKTIRPSPAEDSATGRANALLLSGSRSP